MNKNLILLIAVSTFLSCCTGYKKFVVTDSEIELQTNVESRIDSVYHLKDYKIKKWKIYYEKDNKRIAAYRDYKGDSVIVVNYWRSGKVKRVEKYVGDIVFLEEHCSNGQLIRSGSPNITFKSFYCNGQLEYEFNPATREVKYWDESGKLTGVGHNDVEGKKDGLWKYFENDSLVHVEIFKGGISEYSGDKIPDWYHN